MDSLNTRLLCVLWSWGNTPRARGCVVPSLTVLVLKSHKNADFEVTMFPCAIYQHLSALRGCNADTLEEEQTLCTQQDVNLSSASILLLYNFKISTGAFSILPSPQNKTEVLCLFLFSFWLRLLLFHCHSCQTHFWKHEQQWETWDFKFSWYFWSDRRFCGKSWKQSHTKLFEKMSHGCWLADVFPDPPSSASLTAYVFSHYVYLFVYFFIGMELSYINRKVNT